MPNYNVHLYREMRLSYPGIDAATPEEAARIAASKPTDAAEHIEDCDGTNLAALVDVVGDDAYEESRVIDLDNRSASAAAAPEDKPG